MQPSLQQHLAQSIRQSSEYKLFNNLAAAALYPAQLINDGVERINSILTTYFDGQRQHD